MITIGMAKYMAIPKVIPIVLALIISAVCVIGAGYSVVSIDVGAE
jgi:hypothetical protein